MGRCGGTDGLERRLAAIREFSELGAGFRIAALDLELRGAGNLLGGQQHGHIEAIGFDLYGDRQTAYLCIRVKLTGGHRLTVLRLENLVLLYLMMTFHWERYRADAAPMRTA